MTYNVPPHDPWLALTTLSTNAKSAESEEALLFLIANQTRELFMYRSALILTLHMGEPVLNCISGLTTIDRASAFGSWVEEVAASIIPVLGNGGIFSSDQIRPDLRNLWDEYWPQDIVIMPLSGHDVRPLGLVIFVPEGDIRRASTEALKTLCEIYGLCVANLRARRDIFSKVKALVDGRNLKTHKYLLWVAAAVLVVLLCPVKQFLVAPSEIISLDALAVTAPVDGIVSHLNARPNQFVQKGEVLFRLDDTAIRNRLASAREALEVARAEYLASAHKAFISTERTSEAGVLKGKINERLAEVAYLEEQLLMLDVKAIRSGIAVYGQENDWIGKPVSAGQRVMELADASKLGVNVWVPVADAMNVLPGETITVLLYANPLRPLTATVEQMSYQATRSPDGLAAYRLRATLASDASVRLGLRGNAKVTGDWVVMGYVFFRRPIASLRQWLGI